MPRFEVLPFKPDDYVDAIGQGFPWLDARAAAATYAMKGPAFSGFVDGKLAAVAGVMIPWPGVGHAWAVLTNLGKQHPMFVTRRVLRGLAEIIAEHNLKRVEAKVIGRFFAGHTWIQALGFERECEQPYAAPNGEDFVVYRWLRP